VSTANGQRYVTWKEGILYIISALVAATGINVGTSLYLNSQIGEIQSTHYNELNQDIRELRVEIRRMYIAAREE